MTSDPPAKASVYQRWGKRCFDLVVAVPLFLLCVPILAVVAVLVRLRLGSPVLFRQQRPGRDGVPFEIAKFRTMTDARDAAGHLLPDDQRLPRFGALLRASSLDELPELWAVLTGRMSLVGPRPLLVTYLDHYTAEQARRHEVRPGLTGLAQVNGRNATTWQDRLSWDVQYVDSVSLRLDLHILWRTVVAVVRRSGIAAEGHATMPSLTEAQPRRSG